MLGRRWFVTTLYVVVAVAGIAGELAINLSFPGMAPGAVVGTALVVEAVVFWLHHRIEKGHGPEDPTAPPPPSLPGWLVARPREAEQIAWAVLGARGRAVGITTGLHGAGGFGKTTLAHVVVNDPRVRRRFQGRVYVITVGQDVRGPEQIARRLNETAYLITGELPPLTDPREAAANLGRILDERPPILLLVDDVWYLEQVTPFLQGGARCTRLFTTRIADLLPIGGARVLVDTMTTDQARTLLTWQLGGTVSERLVMALLAATGGWALLLHLTNRAIATRIAAGLAPDTAAQSVLDLVRADPDRVTGNTAALDVSDPAERARAVRATVAAATTQLASEEDVERLRELGVFAEDETIPVDLIARLWSVTGGLSEEQSRLLCHELQRLALVSILAEEGTGGERVRLHDAVRAHLRAQLGDRLPDVHTALIASARRARQIWGTDTAWWETIGDSRYLWDHLVEHMLGAGRDAKAESLATDLRWVEARLRRFGPAAALADLSHLVSARTRRMGLALGRIAHLLGPTQPPSAMADILYSRLNDDPDWGPEAERQLAGMKRPRLSNRWPLPEVFDGASRVLSYASGVSAILVAPDSSWIAVGLGSGSIMVHETRTWRVVIALDGHPSSVTTLAVGTDGTMLVSCDWDGRIVLWDTLTWKILRQTRMSYQVLSIALGPEGRWLAVGGSQKQSVQVLDTRSWKVRARLHGQVTGTPGEYFRVNAIAVAPDGAWLAGATDADNVWVWDTTTWRRRAVLDHFSSSSTPVSALVVAMDGSWLASASSTVVAIWSTETWSLQELLVGHQHSIEALTVGGDGTWLASSGPHDTSIRIWSADSWQLLATLDYSTRTLAGSPVDGWLASGEGRSVRIWDVSAAAAGGSDQAPNRLDPETSAVATIPGGRWFASGGSQAVVRIWDSTTRQPRVMHQLDAFGGKPEHSVYVPYGFYPRAGGKVAPATEGLAIEPTGRWLATSSERGVYVWEADTWRLLASPGGHSVNSYHGVLAVSPDGALLACGGVGGRVWVWETTRWDQVAEIETKGESVVALTFATDSSWLGVAGFGVAAQLWDTEHWRLRAKLPSSDIVLSLAAGPRGLLFAANYEGPIQVWDTGSGQAVRTLDADRGLAISPDGQWLIVHGRRALRIWGTDTWEPVAMMRFDNDIHRCAWLENPLGIVVVGVAGVYVFDYHP